MASDPRYDQAVKIARLYYLEDMSQRDIAAKLNMSLAGVSRSIARARESGLVTITVGGPDEAAAELEILLEKTFGLRECLVVDTSSIPEVMYAGMAGKLAGHLEKVLNSRSVIGVSWGRTLKTLGENLPVIPSGCSAVVPIIGAVGRIETGLFPNSIAGRFADRLGGDGYLVNTPGLVDSPETRQRLLDDSNFSAVADLWRKLDVALFSVSAMGEGDSVRELDVLPGRELAAASGRGAVMMANFLFFDANGQPVGVDLADRIINIGYDALMRVPDRIIAAAGPRKVEPLAAALAGGLCHVLLTDKETARTLVDSAGLPPAGRN